MSSISTITSFFKKFVSRFFFNFCGNTRIEAETLTELKKNSFVETSKLLAMCSSCWEQRLRIDLRQSLEAATATKMVWLIGLLTLPSNSPQHPCNQNDTHSKSANNLYRNRGPTANQSGSVIKISTQISKGKKLYIKNILWHPPE